jgi:glycosyltransferase involved in cell wall biosynthesis
MVVHGHVLLPDGLPLLLAARRRRRPLVVTEHINFLAELLGSRRALAQTRIVLRLADAVLPVSDELLRQLSEIEPRARLRKIANPLDTDLYVPGPTRSGAHALNVAIHLGEAKGTDVLLRAWASARERGPLPELVIVGDGSDRPAMEALARDLGLDGACSFVGLKSRKELLPLLRDAAFLVSASRSENVAGVVTEAIACGTPVVSTRTGEPAGYVKDGIGLLVEPGDVEELACAVSSMAAEHARYDQGHLHEFMRGLYGVDAVRTQLVALYREVLAGRRRGGRSRRSRLP